MMKKILVLLALTCTAHAQDAQDRFGDGKILTQVVRYRDLDLNSPQDLQVLYRRLRGAADNVCAPLHERPLSLYVKWKDCMRGAIQKATADIHDTRLTVYVAGQRHMG